MKILITGASGFLGTGLSRYLSEKGHEVWGLSRIKSSGRIITWNPEGGRIETEALEGFDAVVHLAGENLAGLWTAARRERIYASRIPATRFLSETLLSLNNPPAVLLSASAIGFYGDRGDEILFETSKAGDGFLPRICRDWEAAAQSAGRSWLRVAQMRFGLILDGRGGILGKILPLFRIGLVGRLGSGRQYMSWIHKQDVCRAVEFLLLHRELAGPINVTAPEPVTNRAFTKWLGRVLKRPTFAVAPAWALRLAMGQMAKEMLLSSARVLPQRLLEAGFQFEYPDIERSLKDLLIK